MNAKPLRFVSPEEFRETERRFHKAHKVREGHLPLTQRAATYDCRYDTLIRHLSEVGTLAEGGGEADFSTSRYVDPDDVITVVSDTATVFASGAIDAALSAINESPTQFMVTFDTGSHIGVLPDGSVIGFSESGELNSHTVAPK